MFRVGKLSTQWKRISIYLLSSAARAVCLYPNEFFSALTRHLLLCPYDLCLCACHCTLNCVYVLKRITTMWLVSIAYMTSQIVWYNLKMRRDSKEGPLVHSTSVSVCPCLCVKLFVLILSVCGYIVLTCWRILTCEWRQQVRSSSWGGSPTSLTRNTCLVGRSNVQVCLSLLFSHARHTVLQWGINKIYCY